MELVISGGHLFKQVVADGVPRRYLTRRFGDVGVHILDYRLFAGLAVNDDDTLVRLE